jgi:DNA excision repair protein ERCC-6
MKKSFEEVEISDFESKQQELIDEELFVQQVKLEESRLERLGGLLEKAKIDLQKTQSDRKSNSLIKQIEELKKEERFVLQRLEDLSRKQPIKNLQIEIHKKETEENSDENLIENLSEQESQEEYYTPEVIKEEDKEDTLSIEEFCDDSIESKFQNRISLADLQLPFEIFRLPLRDQIDLHNRIPNTPITENFFAPSSLWNRLFPYQRDGVRWLLGHFQTRRGGILGDEMGLGKSTQIIAFLASLFISSKLDRPVLIISPATLLKQWVNEFHFWFPYMRILLLHSLISTPIRDILKLAFNHGHVVISTYGYLRKHSSILLKCKWKIVALDEGHGIRNPSTEVSQLCRQFITFRRFILSGTPIQNNLLELWTLMDFCQPGLLGSFFAFKTAFSDPIKTGGYVNATHLQIQSAHKCSHKLKDLIEPYLLRRVKSQVAKQLPEKTEKIIFCPLTECQLRLYNDYLQSSDCQLIFNRRKNVLAGIDVLRKICNHPKLLELRDRDTINDEDFYNEEYYWKPKEPVGKQKDVSGKLNVLLEILNEWKRGDHKCLLFCQTRQMLDILEDTVRIDLEFSYLRMDGTTPIPQRAQIIEKFNKDPGIFLFLLTTRVGGLGINLTGADRVMIFDPDWNPSTDLQARERAWRLGQTRPVVIYRLLTEDTIEEKIYQRQIFKQYLSKKILQDPSNSQLFSTTDLYDLFSFPHQSTSKVKELADENLRGDREGNGADLELDILQANNVPDINELINKAKKKLYEAESNSFLNHSLKLINRQEDGLRKKLKSILQREMAPLDTHFILDQLGDEYSDTDATLLKKCLKQVASFDKISKKWTLF